MTRQIVINKNRGWRGLAEVIVRGDDYKTQMRMIFSFSQPVWDDMQEGVMVLQDDKDFHIVRFDRTEALPKGQRSVLLKNFIANVLDVIVIPKHEWEGRTRGTSYYSYIDHFKKNRNNHTQSDWNCIGVRVVPII